MKHKILLTIIILLSRVNIIAQTQVECCNSTILSMVLDSYYNAYCNTTTNKENIINYIDSVLNDDFYKATRDYLKKDETLHFIVDENMWIIKNEQNLLVQKDINDLYTSLDCRKCRFFDTHGIFRLNQECETMLNKLLTNYYSKNLSCYYENSLITECNIKALYEYRLVKFDDICISDVFSNYIKHHTVINGELESIVMKCLKSYGYNSAIVPILEPSTYLTQRRAIDRSVSYDGIIIRSVYDAIYCDSIYDGKLSDLLSQNDIYEKYYDYITDKNILLKTWICDKRIDKDIIRLVEASIDNIHFKKNSTNEMDIYIGDDYLWTAKQFIDYHYDSFLMSYDYVRFYRDDYVWAGIEILRCNEFYKKVCAICEVNVKNVWSSDIPCTIASYSYDDNNLKWDRDLFDVALNRSYIEKIKELCREYCRRYHYGRIRLPVPIC